MEESIKLLDFETVDQMVQIHGTHLPSCLHCGRLLMLAPLDYEGVSLTQRDAQQKAAAKEATSIFQNHYPEFLVRPLPSCLVSPVKAHTPALTVPEVLHQRPDAPHVDLLALQAAPLRGDTREDVRRRLGREDAPCGALAGHPCERAAEAVWRRGGRLLRFVLDVVDGVREAVGLSSLSGLVYGYVLYTRRHWHTVHLSPTLTVSGLRSFGWSMDGCFYLTLLDTRALRRMV